MNQQPVALRLNHIPITRVVGVKVDLQKRGKKERKKEEREKKKKEKEERRRKKCERDREKERK